MIPKRAFITGLAFALGSALGFGLVAQSGCTATDVFAVISPAYRAERALEDYKLERLSEDGRLAVLRLEEIQELEGERLVIYQGAEADDLDTKHSLEDLEQRFTQTTQTWTLNDENRETEYRTQVATLQRDTNNAATLQSGIWAGISLLIGGGSIGAVMKKLGQRWGRAEGEELGIVKGTQTSTEALALAKKQSPALAKALDESPLRDLQRKILSPAQIAVVDQHKTA